MLQKWSLVSFLLILFFVYQNFLVPLRPLRSESLQARFTTIDSASTTSGTTDHNDVFVQGTRDRVGESKAQGAGATPKVELTKDRLKSYISFSVNHNAAYEKAYLAEKHRYSSANPGKTLTINDRSEIRLTTPRANTYFIDDAPGETGYVNFKFFIPNEASDKSGPLDPIINDPVRGKSDWALIWQCAQLKDLSDTRSFSPPISLHIENDVLSVVTLENFSTIGKTDTTPKRNQQLIIKKIEHDRWYNVMVRFHLGQKGGYAVSVDGVQIELNAYYNNSKLVKTKYLPIGYHDVAFNNQRLCSTRFGLYKNTSPGKYEVLFQGITYGNTYERFAP